MSFILLKSLHMTCAAISYTLFFLRGIWRLNESALMQQRWVRIVPHIVDTLLLASAIALTLSIGQYPFADDWLTAKLLALLLYIALGSVALKYGRTRNVQFLAWLAAQLVFAYIVLTALSHNPFLS